MIHCLNDLSLKLNHFYKRCVSITVVIPQALLRANEGPLKSTLLYLSSIIMSIQLYYVYPTVLCLSKTLNITECLGKGYP